MIQMLEMFVSITERQGVQNKGGKKMRNIEKIVAELDDEEPSWVFQILYPEGPVEFADRFKFSKKEIAELVKRAEKAIGDLEDAQRDEENQHLFLLEKRKREPRSRSREQVARLKRERVKRRK